MIEIHNSKNGQFFVRYKGKNGKILSSSETLKTKSNCIKNIIATSGIFRFPSNEVLRIKDFTGEKMKIIVI
mgnify:CR=1 FL=1